MPNIKAICPELRRNIRVLDDWYPAYKEKGKLYVHAYVTATDATQDNIMTKIYGGFFTDDNGNKYKYAVHIAFWGADDTGLEKTYYTNDLKSAVECYRQFKKFLNKLKKQHPKDLKWFLRDCGFVFA